MAKKYIKIFDDTILKQTINQGTEDQRVDSVLGTFSTGELAYTRDTGRVFVGDNGSNDENPQTTIGGSLVGNKYLGMIDSAPLPHDIDEDSSKSEKNDNYYYPNYEKYAETGNGLLEEKSRYRIDLNDRTNWSREAEYNSRYNAYNGDFMYDAAQNALILFDKNIRLASAEDAFVKLLENENGNKYVEYYNKNNDALSKTDTDNDTLKIALAEGVKENDVKYRTPFVNYNTGVEDEVLDGSNPDVFGNGFVVFRNIEPDNDTISFVKRAFKSWGVAQGVNDKSDTAVDSSEIIADNNYSHNLLTVKRVPAEAMSGAMDNDYFTLNDRNDKPADKWRIKNDALQYFNTIGDNGPFTINTSALNLNGTEPTINFGGDGNRTLAFKGLDETNSYDYVLVADKIAGDDGDSVKQFDIYAKKKEIQHYYINLGDGLSNENGSDNIVLDEKAAMQTTAPVITIDKDSLNDIKMLENTPFILWTSHSEAPTDPEEDSEEDPEEESPGSEEESEPETEESKDNIKNNIIFDVVLDDSDYLNIIENEDTNKTVLYTLNKSVISNSAALEGKYKNWYTANNELDADTEILLLKSSFSQFYVAGNNNTKVLTEGKRNVSPLILGFTDIESADISSYPISDTVSRLVANISNPISISSDYKDDLKDLVEDASKTMFGKTPTKEIYDYNSLTIKEIFKYTFIESYGEKASAKYIFDKYFDISELIVPADNTDNVGDTDDIYVDTDIIYKNGPITFIKTYLNETNTYVEESNTSYDIFYENSISGIKAKIGGTIKYNTTYKYPGIEGLYVTFFKDTEKNEESAEVTVIANIIRSKNSGDRAKILQKVSVLTSGNDTESEEYWFTKNYTFIPTLKLPELIKEANPTTGIIEYNIEGMGSVEGYFLYKSGSNTPIYYLPENLYVNKDSEVLKSGIEEVLGGSKDVNDATFNDVDGVIIYTKNQIYTYYLKEAKYIKALQKPGLRKNAYIPNISNISRLKKSRRYDLDETVTNDLYKFDTMPSSLIIEIKHYIHSGSTNDKIEIFTSPSVYKLENWYMKTAGNSIFDSFIESKDLPEATIAENENPYKQNGSGYTYELPTIKNNTNTYNTIISNNDKTGGETHIATLVGNDSVIVEVPVEFEQGLNAKSVAFRIANFISKNSITMRVIGYR